MTTCLPQRRPAEALRHADQRAQINPRDRRGNENVGRDPDPDQSTRSEPYERITQLPPPPGGPGADVQPDSTLPPAQVPAVRAPTGSADGGPSPGGGAQNAVDSEHVPRKSGAALALVADSGCASPAQGRDTRDDTQWCAPSRTGGVLWCGDDVAVRSPRRRMAASRGEPTSKTRHPTQEGSPVGCFRHQLLLPRPYLVLTKPLRLDIQCQRGASVKIGWKYLDD